MFSLPRNLDLLSFDLKSYTKTLERNVGQVFRQAIREWTKTFFVNGAVPVETGMAKASFVPLGRFLNNVGNMTVNPVREPYYSHTEEGIQSIHLGESKQIFRIVDDRSAPGKYEFIFEWDTSTIHWFEPDHYDGKFMNGKQIVELAEQNFDNYFDLTILQRVPEVSPYIEW